MRYQDLIQLGSIEERIRLRWADTPEGAARLVDALVVSPGLAERLVTDVFTRFRSANETSGKGVFLAGNAGLGKTHLLAVLSAVADSPDLARRLPDPLAAEATTSFAGRFHVLRLDARESTRSLQALVGARLEAGLAGLGVRHRFPPRADLATFFTALAGAVASHRAKHPETGLLIVLDGLVPRLTSENQRHRVRDARVLKVLGETCALPGFRLLADLRPGVLHGPDSELPADLREAIAARFETLTLTGEDAGAMIAARLVPKTPDQRDRIGAHLARFADSDPGLDRRREQFVDLFPLHPDFPAMLARMCPAAERSIPAVLAAAVRRILPERLPEDHPGFITFDAYWHELVHHPVLKHRPEVEGVVVAGRSLERALRNTLAPAEQPFARRLVHALAVHRLAGNHIYSREGITPADLLTALGPWRPPDIPIGEDGLPEDPPLKHLTEILEDLRRADGGKYLEANPENGGYGLRFERFRRFVKPELILHWVNAIPFLLLMLTGGLMLAARFARVDQFWFDFAVLAHKTFAVSWLFSLPLVILAHPRAHWEHIRVLLRWGPDDLLWMVQSFRSLYFRKAAMAAVGRFNTGQKTNASLIPIYFAGFGLTGALMHFQGASLFPWYAHTALFFSAMASVGGHLYLALVNPGTRISLPAIFNGWSPMKYVEHHHPLSLPPSRRAHIPPVSARTVMEEIVLWKVEIIMLAAMLAMAGLGIATFNRSRVATVRKQFADNFAEAINPKALSTKHQLGPVAESCTQCHTFTGGIPDARCVACHRVIQDRRTQAVGFHGTLLGPCTQCHKEHPAPNRTLLPPLPDPFDHRRTTFALEGLHARVECDECHKRERPPESGLYFIGLPHESCTDCHAEPHGGQFTQTCQSCHSPAGWTGSNLAFDHARDSRFPLAGAHRNLDCEQCHQPADPGQPLGTAQFRGLGTDCTSCHQDPHRRQLGDTCTACHTPETWRREALTFDHNRDSKFPLADRHGAVACEQCHTPTTPGQALALARFRGLPTGCADCHRDPHRGQFERHCTQCHSTRGWEKERLSFDHNRDSRFPLARKHATTDCAKCHLPPTPESRLSAATFRGLKSDCADCHRDPHESQFARACTRCHTEPAAWTGSELRFHHDTDSSFALTGHHAAVECRRCHHPRPETAPLATARFRGLPADCAGCHEVQHPEAYGTTCLSCHDTTRPWPARPPGPEHFQRVPFDGERLSGRHLRAECRACHVPGMVDGPASFAGRKGTCVACHRADEPHQGTLGLQCARCHGNQSWKGDDLRFNHNTMTRFELDHDHATVACAKCHEPGRWKPLKSSCRDCHPGVF